MGLNDKVVVTYNITAMAQPAPKGKVDESFQMKPVVQDGTLDIAAVQLARGLKVTQSIIKDSLQGSISDDFAKQVQHLVDDAAARIETTNNLMPATAVLAATMSKAKEAFKASVSQLVDQFDPIDDDSFWTYIVILKERLLRNTPPEHFTKRACDNLIWEMVCGDMPGGIVGWQRACEFLHSYHNLVSALNRRCDRMNGLEKGDDSYGDFCDSLPLAGREIVNGLLDEEQSLPPYKTLCAAIDASNPGLSKLICDGENYFGMFLEEKVHSFFSVVARDLNRVKCGKCSETHDAEDINEAGVCIDCQPFDIEEE